MLDENGVLIRSHWLPCALEGEAVRGHCSNPEERGCWLGSYLQQWRQWRVGNQEMSGRFIVTGRGASWVGSEVEREDSEVGGKSENRAPGPNSQP